MPKYKYKGIVPGGQEVTGRIDAEGEKDALRMLGARQIQAYELQAIKTQDRKLKTRKPSSEDYFQILKQFSVLIEADVSIIEAVDSLKRSVSHKIIHDQLDKVAQHLRAGRTLGDAFESDLNNYPQFAFNLIRLGEKTGRLAMVLGVLSEQLALQERMKRDLKSALTYPGFLVIVGMLSVLFIFYVVVPGFSDMVGDNREELPFISQAVFSISDFMNANPIAMLVMVTAAAALLMFGRKIPLVESLIMQFAYRSPILGRLLASSDVANWTRTVGISVAARSHLLEAVTLANESLGSAQLRSSYQDVARDLRSGLTLDHALNKIEEVDPVLLNLVATGVKSGKLADMLFVATEIMDERIKRQAERIGKLAEPIAILFISTIVGIVVIALVTSMTSLYDVAF